ncbi:MAG: hypothetical protein ABL999_12275 [Pyrinomonadaceae bacterium]
MGTEFFNRNKGSIKKTRDKQKAKIEQELLPSVNESNVINFDVWTGRTYNADQKFEVCVEENRLLALQNRNPVGWVLDGKTQIFQEIVAAGGSVVGEFDRYLRLSGKLCLKVKLPVSRTHARELH